MLAIWPLANLLHAQMSEPMARLKTLEAVHAKLELDESAFLAIYRDEPLEQRLAHVTGKLNVFLYLVSREGDEFLEDRVIHHIVTDGGPSYVVGIVTSDPRVYRIRGFNDSRAEFNAFTKALTLTIANADTAELLADFYREVNPDNFKDLTALRNLLQFKQMGELNCQTSDFGGSERAFETWWKIAKPRYRNLSFTPHTSRSDAGFLVELLTLSASSPRSCGGAPLRTRIPISKQGQVGPPAFEPVTGNQ
jgi:hypothetical protein